jgi:hypothetical protein
VIDDADIVRLGAEIGAAARLIEQLADPAAMSDRERRAHERRVARLMGSPDVATALGTIVSTPDIWEGVAPVVDRAGEFQANGQRSGEHHRDLAPLLSGVALNDRAAALFRLGIDRTVAAESEALRQAIRNGQSSSQELVVGSGWHAAVYSGEALAVNPDRDAVAAEGAPFIGGQFSRATRAVHLLNSRTRPERTDEPNRPGSASSLNSMRRSPLQQADVDTKAYGDQKAFGEVVETNMFLASRVMTDMELVRIRVLPRGTVEALLHNPQTGELFTTRHKRVVVAGGIGEELTGFENADEETRRLLDEERATPLAERRILTSQDFIALTGDGANDFPLRGMRNVAIIGPGDTGRVILGKLTGHETESGKSVPTLDWVERIGLYGEGSDTRKEYLGENRPRYVGVALEMPRTDEYQSYYSRVRPFEGRAQRLRRLDDGRIQVISQDAGGFEVRGEYDRVITAAGYRDVTRDIALAPGSVRTRDPRIMDELVQRTFETPGVSEPVLELADGSRVVIDPDSANDVRRLREAVAAGTARRLTIEGTGGQDELVYVEPGSGLLGRLDEAVRNVLRRGRDERDRGEPIARRLRDAEVYLIGPSAELPVSAQERRDAPVLGIVPENTAAGFRYAARDQALAVMLAARDLAAAVRPGTLLAGRRNEGARARSVLRRVAGLAPATDSIPLRDLPARQAELAGEAMPGDLLRMGALGWNLDHEVDGDGDLTVFAQPGQDSIRADIPAEIAGDSATMPALRELLGESMVQVAVMRMSRSAMPGSAGVELRLPVRRGRIDVRRISMGPVDDLEL